MSLWKYVYLQYFETWILVRCITYISPFYNNISQVLYKALKIFYEQFMNPNINVIIHFAVEFTYRLQGIKKLLTDSLNVGKWIYAKYIDKYIYVQKCLQIHIYM